MQRFIVQTNIADHYDFLDKIGEGASGKVFLAKYKQQQQDQQSDETQKKMAINVLSID